MIERFEYYIRENLVRKGYPDKEEAISLMRKALERLEYIKTQAISESTASFVFEDIYEAMREASQSLMALKGYKPYSHEAVIAFLRDFHKIKEPDVSAFNRYRILRNKCVYRGAKVSSETCKDSLGFLLLFIADIRKIFEDSTDSRI